MSPYTELRIATFNLEYLDDRPGDSPGLEDLLRDTPYETYHVAHTLTAAGDAQDVRTLHVVNVHFKSKNPTYIDGQRRGRWEWRSAAGWAEGSFMSAMKRVGQALETRILVDRIFGEAEAGGVPPLIAVCGDFNAQSHEIPVRAVRGMVEGR